MKLTRSATGGVHVLTCSGELTHGKGELELGEAIDAALDAGASRIVVDLSRLARLDSAGIGALVACAKRAADRAAIVSVAVPPESAVRRILLATHLHRVFDLHDDVEAALRAARG